MVRPNANKQFIEMGLVNGEIAFLKQAHQLDVTIGKDYIVSE